MKIAMMKKEKKSEENLLAKKEKTSQLQNPFILSMKTV